MKFEAFTIQYAPARLVIVTTPKVGSTTLISAFLTLAGFETHARDPRKSLRVSGINKQLKNKGLVIEGRNAENIARLRDDHPDYTFVVVMRDPIRRLVSGYLNKINRYCKLFSKQLYWWGKFRQFLEGPRSWGDVNRGNSYMRQFITSEDFVNRLQKTGTEWDKHFGIQSRMNGIKMIRYDRVLLLRELDQELPGVLADCGVPSEDITRLKWLPRHNPAKGSKELAQSSSPEMLALIKSLYQEDFDSLKEYGKVLG